MIVIGEKLNSSIPSVYAAIEKKDSRFVSDLAVKQEEAGAHLECQCWNVWEAEEENLRWLMNTAVQAVSQALWSLILRIPAWPWLWRKSTGKKPVSYQFRNSGRESFTPMVEAAKTAERR